MKAIERQIADAETKIIQQLWNKFFAELEKYPINECGKVRAVLDDLKSYNEISRALVTGDDMHAVRKNFRAQITIFDHHLPECAARIREQIPWL